MKKCIVCFFAILSFSVFPMAALSETDVAPRTISIEQFDKMISELEELLRGRKDVKLSPADRKELEETLKEIRRMRAEIPPGGVFKLPTPAESIAKLEAFKRTPEYAALSQQEKNDLEEALRELRNPHQHEEDERRTKVPRKKTRTQSKKSTTTSNSSNETNRWIFVPKKGK